MLIRWILSYLNNPENQIYGTPFNLKSKTRYFTLISLLRKAEI
jgi:hypothetical protein